MDWDRLGKGFADLVKIVDRLRSPGGCPWDAKQTASSIKTYLLEEAYEVAEAVEGGDPQETCEELGDLLFQIVFMARIASETGEYDTMDVLERISAKMIRRHPHVFGETQVEDAEEVARNWAEIKKREKHETAQAASVLDSVPVDLPALLRAHRITERASKSGIVPGDLDALLKSARDDFQSLEAAMTNGDGSRLERTLGDLLFELACLARLRGVNAENLLRLSNRRFQEDVQRLEDGFRRRGMDMDTVPQGEKEKAWRAIRKERT